MATIDAQDSDLRERIGSFRVLIVGRRNAGKTTILRKVCDTTDNPEIYDTNGKKIHDDEVKATIKRGKHNIKQAMVFKSKPGHVFHDSCGFEGGSEEEFEEMKQFIEEGVHATKLEERIHAIWYCIPMNEWNRTFQKSEEKFFLECDTGDVPVVVIFTKFAELDSVAFGEIEEQLEGLSEEEFSRRISERVEVLFTNTGVMDRLEDPKNRTRPKSCVRLQNMTEPNANCNNLLESTAFLLDDEVLHLCLVSTQQSNLDLCIKGAVRTLLNDPYSSDLQYDIAKWFPHLKLYYVKRTPVYGPDVKSRVPATTGPKYLPKRDKRTGFKTGEVYRVYETVYKRGPYVRTEDTTRKEHDRVLDFNDNLFNSAKIQKEDIIRVLRPLDAGIRIQTGIATIIVLEYSAFLPHLKTLEHVESAIDYYLKSPRAAAVEKGATEISRQGYEKEELERTILEFILENRMSKDLRAKT